MTFLDPEQIDPTWAPPAAAVEEPVVRPKNRLRRLLQTAIPILALALIAGLVWGFGGFKLRKDLAKPVAVGETVSTGQFEFTFSKATVQKTKEAWEDKTYFNVVVSGTARNITEKSATPSISKNTGIIFARDPKTRQAIEVESADIGESQSSSVQRGSLAPGLPPQSYTLNFKFDENYVPAETLDLFVFIEKYGAAELVDDGEKAWQSTGNAYRYPLPITRLPDNIAEDD